MFDATLADALPTRPDILRSEGYRRMLAEDRHQDPEAFLAVADHVFDGIDVAGKRVLEIGSGRGLWSIYLAAKGATVVSLEPEMVGSTSGVTALQQARCKELGLSVTVLPSDFTTWETDLTFDVVVARAVINHLYPSTHDARVHQPTWDGYVSVLRRVHARLAPGGVFVATDASRWAFFLFARNWINMPWKVGRTKVNWRDHQNAGVWVRLLKAAGFSAAAPDYFVPAQLRPVAWLVRNRFAAFWLQGKFIVRAWR